VFSTIYISFLSTHGQFVGVNNYINVLSRKEVLDVEGFPKPPPLGAIVHNLIWTLIHLPLSLILGLAFAVLFRSARGGSIAKSLIFIGMVLPLMVGGLLIRFTFESDLGIVPLFFHFVGVESLNKNWTVYSDTALLSLIPGSVWLFIGFNVVVYSSALANIPKDFEEAAAIDGAGSIQRFFYITLPMLRPASVFAVISTLIFELKTFDIVYIATRGGPGDASVVLSLLVYLFAFRSYDYGAAAAIATLLMLVTLIPAVYMVKLSK